MGVSSTTNRQTPYIGDGSSTIFPFPFYFFTPADLAVYLYDTGSSVVYPQALNTNYTVSGSVNSQGVYPSGGSVVMNSAFPSNLQLIITRSPSQKQNYVLNQNGQINSLALVQQFDYLTTLVQRLQDEVSRSVQLNDGLGIQNNTQFNTTLPSNIILPSNGGAPLVLNSGATGWTFGTVATNASGSVSYLGLLPVPNGGTGQGSALTPGALWYSLNTTQMAQLPQGGVGLALVSNGSSAPSWAAVAVNSGIVSFANGGTANGGGFPVNTVIYSSGASQLQSIPAVGSGFVLQSNGSSAPNWLAFGSINSTSNLVSRDVNGNTVLNNAISGLTTIAAAGGNSFLLASSPRTLLITGSSAQTVILPDATTLFLGQTYSVNNNTNSSITVKDNGANTLFTVAAGAYTDFSVANNGTTNGVWDFHSNLPKQINFGSAGLNLATGSSVQGILPIPNGGTGVSTLSPQFGILYMSSLTQVSAVVPTASGQVLTTNASSAPTFQALPSSSPLTVVSKTASYQMTNSDDVVLVSSSAFTITLPDATTATNKPFRIKKTDSPVATVTLSGSGAQLIGSFNTVNLSTQEECWELITNGVGYSIINHFSTTVPANYTPTISNALGSSSVEAKFWWQRRGNFTKIWGTTKTGTAQATLFTMTLPAGIIIDSSLVFPVNVVGSTGMKVGTMVPNGASSLYNMVLAPATSTTLVYNANQLSGTTPLLPQSTNTGIVINNTVSFDMEIPTVGFFS